MFEQLELFPAPPKKMSRMDEAMHRALRKPFEEFFSPPVLFKELRTLTTMDGGKRIVEVLQYGRSR